MSRARLLPGALALTSPIDRWLARDEYVDLEAKLSDPRIGFIAFTSGTAEEPTALFSAGKLEKRPGLLIYHSATTIGKSRAFEFDDELTVATLDPPTPFAEAQRSNASQTAHRPGWVTAVYLPGVGDLALTRPRFKVKLDRTYLP